MTSTSDPTPTIPLTRHGEGGVADDHLARVLAGAEQACGNSAAAFRRALLSLHLYKDQLWVGWVNAEARAVFSEPVDKAWRDLGEVGRVVQLVPSDDDSYDYQEDVMNNAEA